MNNCDFFSPLKIHIQTNSVTKNSEKKSDIYGKKKGKIQKHF